MFLKEEKEKEQDIKQEAGTTIWFYAQQLFYNPLTSDREKKG